jgi:hypothetical protein
LAEQYSFCSFIAAKFHRAGQVQYFGSHGSHNLKHLGLFFSVWESPDALVLARYDERDEVICLKTRHVRLIRTKTYRKWLGWLIVLSTDAIPFALLAVLLFAGIFLGIGTVIFLIAGFVTAAQAITFILIRPPAFVQKDQMFLDGKLCIRKFFGVQMCILEGPEGELFLIHYMVLQFHHFFKSRWYHFASLPQCRCCQSLVDPVLLGCREYFHQS